MITLQTQGHLDVTGRFRRFVHVFVEECAIKAWIKEGRGEMKISGEKTGEGAKISESNGVISTERPLTCTTRE